MSIALRTWWASGFVLVTTAAVGTFCYCIAREEPITVNDPSVLMEMVFFDDICEEIYDAMEGHPHRCHYEGVEAVPDEIWPLLPLPGET
jgi:hypothetical protein